ncbi:RHS repeat-associated core domain-containing protein [Pseudoalteromonas sp. OOF1S-7]|uniref:RHS repeat-associated core domain-containing protein n=1 Tax=Pseudoalteromonas sp. OOF1S-7 TaxID=2917757 RepID=UPI001EF40D3C|nr:RHS repeat-associated core domain-containing protein [Pseudoalteromonas sp. OOF1S-7]MCG7537923.1 hypothetical protein [Pseudoalteromonas sp. OOF1S-7]
MAFASSKSLFIPISVAGKLIIIPRKLDASEYQAQLTVSNGEKHLTWSSVKGVSKYAVQVLNEDGQWENLLFTHELSVKLDDRFNGYLQVRVAACYNNSCALIAVGSAIQNIFDTQYASVTSAIPSNASLVNSSMPSVDNIGTIKGSAGVSGGGATYSIPIELTPGRAGMQPGVSLNYSSRSGSGIAGKGWSLSAGSAITRCPATYAQDGYSRNPQYDQSDRLCLNGQRLVAISGSYGASGTEYRTEIDSFAKVTQHGAMNSTSSYFVVRLKNGHVSYYGASANSRDIRSTYNGTYAWLIDYTRDATNKNFIHYEYVEYGTNEKLLDRINYTGSSSSHMGMHNIYFEYEQALDPTRKYHKGIMYEKTQRLKRIVTKHNTTQTREYTLSYVASLASGVDLLSSVELCYGATGANCLPKTRFDWEDQAPEIRGSFVNINTGRSISSVLPNGDRNGDGARDWPGFFIDAEGNTTSNSHPMTQCEFSGTSGEKVNCHTDTADYNLDGLTDDFDFVAGSVGSKKKLVLYKNNKNGTSTRINTNIEVPQLSSFLHVGDMNGDSLPDLVIYEKTATYSDDYIYFYYHSGNFSTPYSTSYKQKLFTVGKLSNSENPSTSYSIGGDFDGNGIPDFYRVSLHRNDIGQGKLSSVQLTTSNGRTLSFTSRTVNWDDEDDYIPTYNSGWGRFYRFADLNGDGLKDWFGWYNPKQNGTKLYARYSLGDGRFTAPVYMNASAYSRKFYYSVSYGLEGNKEREQSVNLPKYGDAIKVADIDADGKEELLIPNGIVVEACQNVSHYEFRGSSVTEFCGTEIYNEKIPSGPGTYKSIDGRHDHSIYSFAKLELKGSGFVKADTDFIGSVRQSAMVDAQGDGLPDLVFNYGCASGPAGSNCRFLGSTPYGYARGKVNISRNYGTGSGTNGSRYRPLDILHSVTDGIGLKSEWDYRPLSSSVSTYISGANKLYKADTQVDTGYQNFTSSMYVVKEFKQDNGVGGDFVRRYAYRGALFNNQGRGFMGFRSIIEADVTRGLVTQSDFLQKFPYAGRLKAKATFIADEYTLDGRKLLSTESNAIGHSKMTWADNPSHNLSKVYSPYVNTSLEIKRDISTKSRLATTEVKNTSIDAYGNIKRTEQSHDDHYGETTVVTSRTYDVSTSNWWVNKLTRQIVTKSALRGRSTTDAYILYAGGERSLDVQTSLTTEFSDFHTSRKARTVKITGSSGTGQESFYVFNSYGLPTRVIKKASVYNDAAWTSQTRVETLSYTSNGSSAADSGYYVYETSNARGHKTRVNTDPKTGLKTKVHQQVSASEYVTTEYGYDRYLRPYSQKVEGAPKVYTAIQRPGTYAPRDAVMQVLTVAAGAPKKVAFIDKLGRTIRTKVENQGGDWILQDKTFNAQGYPSFESQPYLYGQVKYGVRYGNYDELGRVDSKTVDQQCSPFSTGTMATEYRYNGFTTTIDVSESCYGLHLGQMSRTYDSRKQLIETKDALNGYTRYSYNGLGLPIVVRDAKGNSIVAKYNAFGHKTRVNDPNQGATDFIYNGFGEVQRETRSNGKSVHYNVDSLGRVVKRAATGESTLNYTFDAHAYGQLSNATGNGVTHSYQYDSLGRPTVHTVTGEGRTFATSTYYDANYGRAKGMRYPNNLTLEFVYDERGYQVGVKNKASGYTFQQVTARDVFGQIQSQTLGNGLQMDNYYSRQSGQMTEHYTHKNGSNLLAIQYTGYDGFGNLKSLSVTSGKLGEQHQFTESYSYDDLHRLKSNAIGGYTTIRYNYDSVGNLTSKSDYATQYDYTNRVSGYTGGGVNAVKRVYKNGQWVGFSYDARGNMTKGDGLSAASYNAMDKPTSITKNGITASFTYGPDHMRFKQVKGSVTSYYAGKHYELEVEGNKTTTRAYIGDIAVISSKSGSVPQIRYFHKDRLGSARLITNADGYVVAERNFDPFGKPRAASGGLKFTAQLNDYKSAKTRRGFTDHEHLDDLELIHMNGRVYDYNLGRFMSVDPVIQSPGNSQSINPYSYIMNNPLGGTDPTGYSSACQSKGADVSGDSAPGCGDAMSYDMGEGDKLIKMDNGSVYLDQGGDTLIKVDSIKLNGTSGLVANIDMLSGSVTSNLGSQESIGASNSNNQSQNSGWGIWDTIQAGLDVAGMVPILGEIADFANAGISVVRGDYEGAALSTAAMVPFVGNAAGAAKIARSADKAGEALTAGKKGPDFIVGPRGTTVSTSQTKMRQSFSNMPSEKLPDGKGIKHHMPDGGIVRTMEPTKYAGRRASFTNKNGEPVNPFTGKPPQPPRGLTKAERKQFVRSRTHVEQDL